MDFLLVVLLGVLVGLGEIVSRYRDAPVRALGSLPAGLYLGLNGAASWLALVLVRHFGLSFGFDGSSQALSAVQVLVSGFGVKAGGTR